MTLSKEKLTEIAKRGAEMEDECGAIPMASRPKERRAPDLTHLEKRFKQLAASWAKETGFTSDMSYICSSQSYKAIIRLGHAVVPIIMQDMEREPNWWFEALEQLTKHQPHIDPEEAGRLDRITKIWLDWWATKKNSWFRTEQFDYALRYKNGSPTLCSFFPSLIQMSLCGDPPYYKVRLVPDEDGDYFTWHDFERDRFHFTNKVEVGVEICFAYGSQPEIKAGRGEIIRVRAEVLGTTDGTTEE